MYSSAKATEPRSSGSGTSARGEFLPTRRGFDEFDGYHHRATEYERDVGEFLPHYLTRQSLDFIRRNQDRPFLLIVSFSAPHSPVRAPQQYLDRVQHQESALRRRYLGLVIALDEAVGRIVSGVEEQGLTDQTLVVFANDNGGPGVSDCCAAKNGSSNAPLRGFKQQLYEGGIRVPLIMRWPGALPSGALFEDPVTLMDLFPTAASAAGIGLSQPLDGIDLLPYLDGERDGPPHPRLFWAHHGDRAIREGPWKLLLVEGSDPQLFDLSRDRSETKDLAASETTRVGALSGALEEWYAGATVRFVRPNKKIASDGSL